MLINDEFEDLRSSGAVIGSASTSGPLRQGTDVEETLSIDNGALRISPLITPGWGRSGLAYGPFQRQPGLALSVFLLNGHNASEGNSIEETLKGRFFRWLRGSETHSIPYRLKRWATSPHHQHRRWHFYRWLRNHKRRFEKDKHIKENLAVGWFDSPTPTDPTAGSAIVVRTAGPENGDLCTTVEGHLSTAFRGLQNLQVYYVVVLRACGAAYYAATLPDAHGLSAYPYMRLVGIDTQAASASVYAGIHQAALGQVGFRVDSRVYGVRAAALPELSNWYGTAQIADLLMGSGLLDSSETETGEVWRSLAGNHQRTPSGIIGTSDENISIVTSREPIGALHIILETEEVSECAILWRTQNEPNASALSTWALFLNDTCCSLKLCEQGQWTVIESDAQAHLTACTHHTIQILDTGDFFSLYLSGKQLFHQSFTDQRLKDERGVGILSQSVATARFRQIEAHPRNIAIPPALCISSPWQRRGTQAAISESFSGPRQERLESQINKDTGCKWEKTIGKGELRLTGHHSVRVEASANAPNPGRLAYTLPWQHPSFADVSVDICSPGKQRYEREKGRGGLIFWQDADNYMIINHWLDDTFEGSAMSVFLTLDGYEEIYDGVWANLGKRIAWGQKRRHRVTFDGSNFVVYVEEEPVLYRAIRDIYPTVDALQINRIGIVANWEWGDDTGSTFSQFSALS